MTDRLSDEQLDSLFGRFAAKSDRHPGIFAALVELRERRAEVKRLKAALREISTVTEGIASPSWILRDFGKRRTTMTRAVPDEHYDAVRSARGRSER